MSPVRVQRPAPSDPRDELTPLRDAARRTQGSPHTAAAQGVHAHFYVRLRLRQDHLAELWLRKLTLPDVLVWQPERNCWTPFLKIPALHETVTRTGDGGLRELGDAIAGRPAPRPERPPPPSARARPLPPPGYSTIPPAIVAAPPPHIPKAPRAASIQLASCPTPAPTPSVGLARRGPPSTASQSERMIWLASGLLAGMAVAVLAGRLGGIQRRERPTYTQAAVVGASVSTRRPDAGSLAATLKRRESEASARSATPEAAASEATPVLAASALPTDVPAARGGRRRGGPSASPARASNRAEAPVMAQGVALAPFDRAAARAALTGAAQRAWSCGAGEASGAVVISFAPSGAVQSVSVSGLEGDVRKPCVTNAFRGARLKPFAGASVTVQKSFRLR